MIERLMAYGLGSYQSYQAVQRAKKKYPHAKHFTVDHTGPVPVARPSVATPVEKQQERLARRLKQLARTL